MLPHIRARPVTMERYPAGIGRRGSCRRTCRRASRSGCERVEVPKKGGTVHHPLVADTRSLLWLANQNTITPHVWTSRAPHLYQPDICVFDLDPSVRTSRTCCAPRRSRCAISSTELGLPSWVKTSGSKGFHIVVPLDGKADSARSHGSPHAVGTRCWSGAIPSTSRRSSARPIAADASSSTPAATATARRSPPPTPCARSPARRSRRRAHGRSSSAARSTPQTFTTADDGRTDRGGRRPLGGHEAARTVAQDRDGAVTEALVSGQTGAVDDFGSASSATRSRVTTLT